MTTDEAIALIPAGYLLSLENWVRDTETLAWEAVVTAPCGKTATMDKPTPAEAIIAAIAELGAIE